MIRPCSAADFDTMLTIINDGAQAYRSVIPQDRWHDPYMPDGELRQEIASGISFFGAESRGGGLVGVMGVQPVQDVLLIRHAYVRTDRQRRGAGSELLSHLMEHAERPVLIGTWAAARWAIRFYEKHRFALIEGSEKDRLLRTYWRIPERQVETSVVMADPRAMGEIIRPSAEPEPEPERE